MILVVQMTDKTDWFTCTQGKNYTLSRKKRFLDNYHISSKTILALHVYIAGNPLPCGEISRVAGFRGVARFRENTVICGVFGATIFTWACRNLNGSKFHVSWPILNKRYAPHLEFIHMFVQGYICNDIHFFLLSVSAHLLHYQVAWRVWERMGPQFLHGCD